MKRLALLFICFVLLFSCEQEENEVIDSDLLIGPWRLEKVLFNQTDGEEINDWISNSTVLKFEEDEVIMITETYRKAE